MQEKVTQLPIAEDVLAEIHPRPEEVVLIASAKHKSTNRRSPTSTQHERALGGSMEKRGGGKGGGGMLDALHKEKSTQIPIAENVLAEVHPCPKEVVPVAPAKHKQAFPHQHAAMAVAPANGEFGLLVRARCCLSLGGGGGGARRGCKGGRRECEGERVGCESMLCADVSI